MQKIVRKSVPEQLMLFGCVSRRLTNSAKPIVDRPVESELLLVTDACEMKTLAQLGIACISLSNAAPATPMVIGGNSVSRVGSFTRSDGSNGQVGDIVFAISDTNTRYLGDSSVSVAAAALPQLTGFGLVKDLRVAMTQDVGLRGQRSRVAVATKDTLILIGAEGQRSSCCEAAFRFAKQLGAGARLRTEMLEAKCSYFVSCDMLAFTANDNALILQRAA